MFSSRFSIASSWSKIRFNKRSVSGAGEQGKGVGGGQCRSSSLSGLLGRDGGYTFASFSALIDVPEFIAKRALKTLYIYAQLCSETLVLLAFEVFVHVGQVKCIEGS